MRDEEMIPQIARVCHEANRAYCQTIGDDTQVGWGEASSWQKDSALEGVRFHLTKLAMGEKPSPAESHEKWRADKARAGWVFGPVKDAAKKEHPCMVGYEDLPVEQRTKDYIFASICQAFWDARGK